VEVINRTFQPDLWVRGIADFGEPVLKNRVKIRLGGLDYRRRLLVEGRNENQDWEVVVEDQWLIRISQGGKEFIVDTVDFPVNDFRYLRLTVFQDASQSERLEIESVQGALTGSSKEKELVHTPISNMMISSEPSKGKTIVEMDLGYSNLPIVCLSLRVTNPYYYRALELFGGNSKTEQSETAKGIGWKNRRSQTVWRSLFRGVVFRIHHENRISTQNKMMHLNAPYRYLSFHVFDGDNPPLNIEQVDVWRREVSLVFRCKARGQYKLIGGNPKALHPAYDLAQAVKGLDELDLPVVNAGPLKTLKYPSQAIPWSERNRMLLWTALLLAVIVMVFLIVRNLTTIRKM
jgi:hypothetical protein